MASPIYNTKPNGAGMAPVRESAVLQNEADLGGNRARTEADCDQSLVPPITKIAGSRAGPDLGFRQNTDSVRAKARK